MEELKKSNKIKQLKRVEKEKINKAEQEDINRVILCITKFNRGSNLHIASLLRCIY